MNNPQGQTGRGQQEVPEDQPGRECAVGPAMSSTADPFGEEIKPPPAVRIHNTSAAMPMVDILPIVGSGSRWSGSEAFGLVDLAGNTDAVAV